MPPTDHDTNWKILITDLWEDFVDYFLPEVYPLIDFSKKPEFLEQELHKIVTGKTKKGKKFNDKLVKVFLKDGTENRILVHIEVQGKAESDFTRRMFVYYYRVFDKHGDKITAIVIYTGKYIPENYDKFQHSFLGSNITYEFNTFIVKDADESELLKSRNPFSLAVLTAKYWNITENNAVKRLRFKQNLIRLSIERNYKRQKIVSLLRFINYLLILPENFEKKFVHSLDNIIKFEEMDNTLGLTEVVDVFFRAKYGMKVAEWEEKIRKKIIEKEKKAAEAKVAAEAEKAAAEAQAKAKKFAAEAKATAIKAATELLLETDFSVKKIANILNLKVKDVQAIKNKLEKK